MNNHDEIVEWNERTPSEGMNKNEIMREWIIRKNQNKSKDDERSRIRNQNKSKDDEHSRIK